jgi:hypothetical protein
MGRNPAFRGTPVPVHLLAELVPSRMRARTCGRRGSVRPSEDSAGPGEAQLTDHLAASLAAHENFTGLIARQNRPILAGICAARRYFTAHQNLLPKPYWNKTRKRRVLLAGR